MDRKNTFLKLKEDHDHLQKRFLEFFEYGRKRESKLEHTVANVWNYLSKIKKGKETATIAEICDKLIPFLEDAMKEE